MLSREEYHRVLATNAAAFIDVVANGEPTTPVPSCPGWTLLDLARHLGSVHRWAADCIVTAAPADETEGPVAHHELVPWLRMGAWQLLDLLEDTDPLTPTWTFGPPPRTVSFWSRRQAHETTIHLWDATAALGSPVEIAPDLAADGVDEVIRMFFPRQVRLQRIPPLAEGILVELDEVPGVRYVLAGDGTDPLAATQATLRGPASDVLLALWGRAGLEALSIDGDPDLVQRVLRAGIVP